MMTRLLILTLAFVVACSPVEEKDTDIPGSDNPSLTSLQKNQSGIVTGSIGDLISYIHSRSSFMPMGSNKADSFRKPFRDRLAGSINENLCLENATSQVYDLDGDGCAVRLYSSFTRFTGSSDDGASVNRYRFSVDFISQKSTVVTDLQSLKLEGSYGNSVKIDGDINQSQEQMQVGADGVSKTLGEFRFVSSMVSNRQINFETGARIGSVQRTDTFEYKNFKAVFFYESERNGDEEVSEFYINGDSVSQLQYVELIQEFSNQLDFQGSTTKRFLIIPGSFDPFTI